MPTIREASPWRRRARQTAFGASAVVLIAYATAVGLHGAAFREVEAARRHIAHADWLAAARCLDRARLEDPFLVEISLLRATAIIEQVNTTLSERYYRREEALDDVEWYVRYRPGSGEGHYRRGLILASMGRAQPAREAFDRAIEMLPDPADALVHRAELFVRSEDYRAAVADISRAIERKPLEPSYYRVRRIYRNLLVYNRTDPEDPAEATAPRPGGTEPSVGRRGDDRPIAGSRAGPAASAERARLLGTWVVLEKVTDNLAKDILARDSTITFGPERYRLVRGGRTIEDSPFWIDPDTRPARIDWMATRDGKERRLLGIYELRGDELLIAMAGAGGPRPPAGGESGPERVEFFILGRASAR